MNRGVPIFLITFFLASLWMNFATNNNIGTFSTYATGLIGGFFFTSLLIKWYDTPDKQDK